MGEQREGEDEEQPRQGFDEGVVVSADAGTVSGTGADEELDEIEAEESEADDER